MAQISGAASLTLLSPPPLIYWPLPPADLGHFNPQSLPLVNKDILCQLSAATSRGARGGASEGPGAAEERGPNETAPASRRRAAHGNLPLLMVVVIEEPEAPRGPQGGRLTSRGPNELPPRTLELWRAEARPPFQGCNRDVTWVSQM